MSGPPFTSGRVLRDEQDPAGCRCTFTEVDGQTECWDDDCACPQHCAAGHGLNCESHGPDGAMCQKVGSHVGDHGGVDARGTWRRWLGGDS